MIRINQFNIEPGVYHFNGQDIVVTEIVTHRYQDGVMKEIEPIIVYRDLIQSVSKHIGYSMDMEEFKVKFKLI